MTPPPPAPSPPEEIIYICQACQACCSWPGFVRVSNSEIDRMAAYLGIASAQFVQSYCDLLPSRAGLTVRSLPSHACIFLKDGGCQVHQVKPDQCVAFPNGWNFPGWREICKARPSTPQDPAPQDNDA